MSEGPMPDSHKVTDHAIVRYVERVLGISRAEMEEKVVPRGMSVMNDGTHSAGTHRVVIRGGKVVTVLDLEETSVGGFGFEYSKAERGRRQRQTARKNK